jgi:hypothetical protein
MNRVMGICISQDTDWNTIAGLGGPVVDPMIVRSADLFIRGGSRQDPRRDNTSSFLGENVNGLGMFFDRLILNDQIPVFNYRDSFVGPPLFDQDFFDRVNGHDAILVDVDVQRDAYLKVEQAASAELLKLYLDGKSPAVAQDAYNILGELSDSEFTWYPQTEGLELPNISDERLAGYILGGLIFGGYAQLANAEHLMQPKRSRLFLAASLGETAERTAEEHLFASLNALRTINSADVYAPTFFPLLLHECSTPSEVLSKALALRASSEVSDYRHLLQVAMEDFEINGHISTQWMQEMKAIRDAIQRQREGLGFPAIEIKMSVAELTPEVSIDVGPAAGAFWGWFLSQLPGRRHRKLLTRSFLSDLEYVNLKQRLQTVWYSNT